MSDLFGYTTIPSEATDGSTPYERLRRKFESARFTSDEYLIWRLEKAEQTVALQSAEITRLQARLNEFSKAVLGAAGINKG